MGLGVWAELLSDAEVDAALPELSRVGSRIGLAVPAARIGEPSLAELVRRGAELGVSMRAWLLLPEQQGYWVGKTNVSAFSEALEALIHWRNVRGGPPFSGVSVDLEPAYQYSEALRTSKKSRPDRWLGLLASHLDRAAFARAQASLSRAVASAHRAGLSVHAVTYPLILDQPEGDVSLEDAFDIPVSGIDWDEVSVMAYQTAFAQQLGLWLGPDLVHSYAAEAVARYGERAGIDVGVVGDAGIGLDPGDRYSAPDALFSDVAAALAAGIPEQRIRVYGLAGMVRAGGVRRWLGTPALEARAPEPSLEVRGLRAGARALATALRSIS